MRIPIKMKYLYLFFALTFVTHLSAQDIADSSRILNDTNKTLQLQTQSLIAFALTDSLYSDIRYVVDHYAALVVYTDSIRKKSNNKRGFLRKTTYLSEAVIFNPFAETDYPFVLKQHKDTSSFVLLNPQISMILIPGKDFVTQPCLLLEKPIFSYDMKQAYLRTLIDYKGGCRGYETSFIFENKQWKKSKFRLTYKGD